MRSNRAAAVTLRTLVDPLCQDAAGQGLRVDPIGNVHYDGAESSDSDGESSVAVVMTEKKGESTSANLLAASSAKLKRTPSYKKRSGVGLVSDAGGGDGGGLSSMRGGGGAGGGSMGGIASVLERAKGLLVDTDGSILPSSLNPTRPLNTLFNSTALEFTPVPFRRPNVVPSDTLEAGRFAPPALTLASSVGFECEDTIVLFGGAVAVGGGGGGAKGASSSSSGSRRKSASSSLVSSSSATSNGLSAAASSIGTRTLNDTWLYSVLDKQWSKLDVMETVGEALVRARRSRGFSADGILPPPRSGHCAVGIREVQVGVTATSNEDAAKALANSAALIGNHNSSGHNNTRFNNNNNNTLGNVSSIARNASHINNPYEITSNKDLFLPTCHDTLGQSVLFGASPAQQILLAGKTGANIPSIETQNQQQLSLYQQQHNNNSTNTNNNSNKRALLLSGPSPHHAADYAPNGSYSSSIVDPKDPDPWAYRPSMIVFGGANVSMGVYFNDLWLFDVQVRAWKQLHPGGQPPSPRWKCTAAALEQRVFIFGGETSDYKIVNDLHMYDCQSNMWRSLRVVEPCPRPRMSHSVCTVGDKMVIVGGVDGAAYAARAASMATPAPALSSSPPCNSNARCGDGGISSSSLPVDTSSTTTTGAKGGAAPSQLNQQDLRNSAGRASTSSPQQQHGLASSSSSPAASGNFSFSPSANQKENATANAAPAKGSRGSKAPAAAAAANNNANTSNAMNRSVSTGNVEFTSSNNNNASSAAAHAAKPIPPLSDVWCLDMRTLLWRELGVFDKRNSVFALHEYESKAGGKHTTTGAGGGGVGELGVQSTSSQPPGGGLLPVSEGGEGKRADSVSTSRGGGGNNRDGSVAGSPSGRFFGSSRSSSPRGFFNGNGLTVPGAPMVSGYGSLEGHVALGFNQHVIIHGGLINGKWNQKVFSFDTVNETWQFHGEISTTGTFSTGEEEPNTSSGPSVSATTFQPDGSPPTKPHPRAFHCGGAFILRTVPHSLREFDTIGKMHPGEGQIHLSELKETEPLLDFFAVTRAQQLAETGILSIYKNRPVTQRTICVFMFGGQSFPRNMSDLWMLRLSDNTAVMNANLKKLNGNNGTKKSSTSSSSPSAVMSSSSSASLAIAPLNESNPTMGSLLAPSGTKAEKDLMAGKLSTASRSANLIVSTPSGGRDVNTPATVVDPSVPLIATGLAQAYTIPMMAPTGTVEERVKVTGKASPLPGSTANLLNSTTGGGFASIAAQDVNVSAASPSTPIRPASRNGLNNTPSSTPSTANMNMKALAHTVGSNGLSKQAFADVLYAATKGGVLSLEPTAVLPQLLSGGGGGGAGGVSGATSGYAAMLLEGGAGVGSTGKGNLSSGTGTTANSTFASSSGGIGATSASMQAKGGASPIAHLRDLKRQAARRDDGTYARSQRINQPENYFPAIEAFAVAGEEAEVEDSARRRLMDEDCIATSVGRKGRLGVDNGGGGAAIGNGSFASSPAASQQTNNPQQRSGLGSRSGIGSSSSSKNGAPPSGRVGGGGRPGNPLKHHSPIGNNSNNTKQHAVPNSQQQRLASDDGHAEELSTEDDDDSDDDEEAMDAQRRQRIEERKQRLVEQLRNEIINASHQYILGGQKAVIKKQANAQSHQSYHPPSKSQQ